MFESGRRGNIRFVFPATDPGRSLDLLYAVTGREAALFKRVGTTLPERDLIYGLIWELFGLYTFLACLSI